MKEQVLPDIPLQLTPSTSSMYDLLRSTSQKWFQRSHKRIFDNPSQAPSSSINFNHLQDSRPPQSSLQQTSDKARIIELMREQIDIACQQYSIKTKNVIQEQAKRIKALNELLMQNQAELKKKDQLVAALQKNLGQLGEKKGSGGEQFKQIAAKIKNIENRLREVEHVEQENGRSLKGEKTAKQIQKYFDGLKNIYFNRLEEVHEDLEDRVDRIDKMSHLNQSLRTSIRSPTRGGQEIYQIKKKCQALQTQLEDLKDQMASFKEKQYMYDNYKLEQLQAKMSQINGHLNQLQRNRSKSRQHIISSCKINNLKSSQTTQLTSTAFRNSKTRFVNKYKSLITQRKKKESGFSSQNYESSNQSEVEETILEDQESKLDRFIKLVQSLRVKMPLAIETDPTGYVRSVETGMYLLDPEGNAFELNEAELTELQQQKIIKL